MKILIAHKQGDISSTIDSCRKISDNIHVIDGRIIKTEYKDVQTFNVDYETYNDDLESAIFQLISDDDSCILFVNSNVILHEDFLIKCEKYRLEDENIGILHYDYNIIRGQNKIPIFSNSFNDKVLLISTDAYKDIYRQTTDKVIEQVSNNYICMNIPKIMYDSYEHS